MGFCSSGTGNLRWFFWNSLGSSTQPMGLTHPPMSAKLGSFSWVMLSMQPGTTPWVCSALSYASAVRWSGWTIAMQPVSSTSCLTSPEVDLSYVLDRFSGFADEQVHHVISCHGWSGIPWGCKRLLARKTMFGYVWMPFRIPHPYNLCRKHHLQHFSGTRFRGNVSSKRFAKNPAASESDDFYI